VRSGIWKALGAQVAWGLFPFYWKQIEFVPALQVMAHRIVWSFLTLAAVMPWMGHGTRLREAVRSGRGLVLLALAGILISANWFTYIWAVSNNYIVESSLGYFINPLVTVLIGIVFFGERLRGLQWLAVGCAGAGVLYLAIAHGQIPWIALALTATFATYSALKKLAPLGAVTGLTVETGCVTIPALVYLIYADRSGTGAFLHAGTIPTLFMAGAGIATTIPLLLFASSVREIPLTLTGVLQYVSPILQLLTGVLFYHEAFGREQVIGFSGVWAGLTIFWIDGWLARRR
jgi:chloramphenicol-sensitive protein RarD